MEQKRILIIDPHPGFGGGASESLIDFLNTVDRERFDIYLMIPDSKPLEEGIQRKTKQKKIAHHLLTENINVFQYLSALVWFLLFLLKNRINLIYVSDWGPTWKPAELLAAKIVGIPLISHVRVPPGKGAEKSFLKFSKLIIGNSDFTLAPLRSGNLPLKRIYNSINLEQFDKGKSTIVPAKGEIKIAFVGRVRIRKGVMVYIDAAEEVLKRYKNAHFYIVGYDKDDEDGCLDKAKEIVTSKWLSEYFTFTGLLFDAPQFMKRMDIIVVPSIFEEPFGRPNIEAMAAGKPVIASRVGGIPEIIEHNKTGLLVPKRDVKALADAMVTLINNKDLRIRLGSNGRKVVEERFNSKSQVKKIEQAFNENIIR